MPVPSVSSASPSDIMCRAALALTVVREGQGRQGMAEVGRRRGGKGEMEVKQELA